MEIVLPVVHLPGKSPVRSRIPLILMLVVRGGGQGLRPFLSLPSQECACRKPERRGGILQSGGTKKDIGLYL